MYVGQEVFEIIGGSWRVFGLAMSHNLLRLRVPEEGYEVLGDGEFVRSNEGVYTVPILSGIAHKPKVQAFLEKWKKLTEKRFSEDERLLSYSSEVAKTLDELNSVEAEIIKLENRREDLRRLRNDYDSGFRIETSMGLMKRGLETLS